MGFFDRLLGKNGNNPPRKPAPAPTPGNDPEPAADASSADATPTPPDAGPVAPRLDEAFEQLELRNLEGAREIYEEILASSAGERPDVLVRISGDLGSTGHVQAIPDLIAPLYDATRHGPATGMNLLQAYLALRQPEAAQHVLDLLFELKNPDLEERLWGFSNAIGEMMQSSGVGGAGGKATEVNLVSISKPIWAYGIEELPGLLPDKSGATKTVAFAQLTLPGREDTDEMSRQPETDLGRFTRGLPLWLAETLYFSPQYHALAAVGVVGQKRYMDFPAPWTGDNIRQLIDSAGSKIDYVMTGEFREHEGDSELSLHLWEIKGFRERKTFKVAWTPSNADHVLADLHEQIRFFFEWQESPGLPYQPTTTPRAWLNTLGASLSTFLGGKNVLPPDYMAPLPDLLIDPGSGDSAALARLTLDSRAAIFGLVNEPATLPDREIVRAARNLLPPS